MVTFFPQKYYFLFCFCFFGRTYIFIALCLIFYFFGVIFFHRSITVLLEQTIFSLSHFTIFVGPFISSVRRPNRLMQFFTLWEVCREVFQPLLWERGPTNFLFENSKYHHIYNNPFPILKQCICSKASNKIISLLESVNYLISDQRSLKISFVKEPT